MTSSYAATVQTWLRLFLTAIAVEATDAGERVERLCDLRERYRNELAATRSRAAEVVDLMFANPIVTVPMVVQHLAETRPITHPGATNLIKSLENRGWLHPLGALGSTRRQYWSAREVMEVIETAFVPPVGPPSDSTRS